MRGVIGAHGKNEKQLNKDSAKREDPSDHRAGRKGGLVGVATLEGAWLTREQGADTRLGLESVGEFDWSARGARMAACETQSRSHRRRVGERYQTT